MKKIIFPLVLIVSLSGCLTTLHPIFNIADLVTDHSLTGTWKNSKNSSLTIYRKSTRAELTNFPAALQQHADKIYRVTVSGSDQSNTDYFAFLVKLGRHYYLDYYPVVSNEPIIAGFRFSELYIPMHGIYRVDFNSSGSFELKQLNGGYLENLIKKKQIRIAHTEMEDGSYLITAPTGDLQQYLIKYSDVPEAYDTENSSVYNKIN